MKNFKEYLLREALEDSYNYTFDISESEVEADDWGEESYTEMQMDSTQKASFQTEEGQKFLWTATENIVQGSSGTWEIAFGTVEDFGDDKIQIELTGQGNAFRILSTVVEITAEFLEYSKEEPMRVQYLKFRSKGSNRTKLYKNRLIPALEKISGVKLDLEREEEYNRESTLVYEVSF